MQVDNQRVGKFPATRMVLEQDSQPDRGSNRSPVIRDVTLGWWKAGKGRKNTGLRIQPEAQSVLRTFETRN